MLKVQKFTFNPYRENTYIVFNELRQCAIIDPGMYDANEQNEISGYIKEHQLNPILLLNTHAHIDHVLGNKYVFDNWGLKPQMNEGELPFLHAVIGYAPQMGIRYEPSPDPEQFLPETGDVLLGNDRFELIFAPGHSAAHLCFYAPEENFLIGGDVLFYNSIGRTDLPGGNHQQLLESIKTKLWRLPDDCIVYAGHGPETTIGFEKKTNPFLIADNS